jgi:hypothetical protein
MGHRAQPIELPGDVPLVAELLVERQALLQQGLFDLLERAARFPEGEERLGESNCPFDVLVLDLGQSSASVRAFERLPELLARFGGVVLALASSTSARAALGDVAGIRVALERRAWLAVGRDLVGERVHATVARHRWALAGASAQLDLWFSEGRRIDPLLPSLAAPKAAPATLEDRPALQILSA